MVGAGWFQDPDDGARMRWWDGQQWTPWVSVGGQTVSVPLGQAGTPAAAVTASSALGGAVAQPLMPAPSYPTGTLPPAGVAERFQSLRGLSVALLVLFILSALALVWSAIALFVRSGKVADFRDGGDVSFNDLSTADDAVGSGLGFTIMLGIAVFVLLIIWLWRAYSNTRVFGAAPWRFGRGWTIGAWFIPFANFVIPKMLINDAWRGADRDAPGNPQWRKLPVAAIITLWWFSYVIAVFLLRVASALYDVEDMSLDTLVGIDVVTGVIALVAAGAAVLGAVAIPKLSRRQHERAAELGLA